MTNALRSKETKAAETAEAAEPIGAEEFAALMEGFAPFSTSVRVAVAVSGGPDSMALAFCAKRWYENSNPSPAKTKDLLRKSRFLHPLPQGERDVVAFIIDHGLRAESPAEALQTQKSLARIGIEAEILRWEHAPVTASVHEIARKARYRLLIDACRRHGIFDLLLAHHNQDQAETILMRLAKGSGIDGLAGMPAQSEMDGVRILRPCLGIARERLLATCAAANLPFVSDPSNKSAKYARGRLRRILPLLAEEDLTIERINDLGARAAEAKAALDHATGMLLRVGTRLDDAGVIHIDLEHLRPAPKAIGLRALAACLQAIHPEDYAPQRAALTRLYDSLCADAPMPACTLQGCLAAKDKTHATIMREFSAIADALPIKPGESVIWDMRWRVTLESPLPHGGRGRGPVAHEVSDREGEGSEKISLASEPSPASLSAFAEELGTLSREAGEGFIIRPLGNPPHETLDRLAPGLRKRIPQGRARACLPALWLKDALALIPALPNGKYEAVAHAELAVGWPPIPGSRPL